MCTDRAHNAPTLTLPYWGGDLRGIMSDVLQTLYDTICARKGESADSSYTAKLMHKGVPHIAKKLGEEAVETALAAASGDRAETIKESADVLFHMEVLWAAMDIAPSDVWAELERRAGVSGLVEKASRKE